jgi:hypothetical protein
MRFPEYQPHAQPPSTPQTIRRQLLTVIALCIGFALAACGGSDESPLRTALAQPVVAEATPAGGSPGDAQTATFAPSAAGPANDSASATDAQIAAAQPSPPQATSGPSAGGADAAASTITPVVTSPDALTAARPAAQPPVVAAATTSPAPRPGANSSSASSPAGSGPSWATYERPFARDSLWNSRPVNPVLDMTVIPPTRWGPTITANDYSVAAFLAQASDGPMTVHGPDGQGVGDPDTGHARPITVPRWPAAVAAAPGTDGHADIVDPIDGVVHSFWQLRREGGTWRATMYAWAPLAGRGWGDPAHYYQGARATGVPSIAGLIRKHEINDGQPLYRHALALSLDASALSAQPAYVFPATAADFNAATTNTGSIPQGALLMLPAGFDTARLRSAALRKVAETLKVYGARVVDRNTTTRFALYAEIGSGFNLMPQGWDNTVAEDLQIIADALRPLVSASVWLDGDGQSFVPSQKLNMLSMRGPWMLEQGGGGGSFDSARQALVFPSTGSTIVLRQTSGNGIGRLAWAQLRSGTTYRFSVEAAGNATLKLEFRSPSSYAVTTATPSLGHGQQATVTVPTDGSQPVLVATSAGAAGAWIRGRLVEE